MPSPLRIVRHAMTPLICLLLLASPAASRQGMSVDVTARYLAGLTVGEGVNGAKLFTERAFRQHARFSNRAWKGIEAAKLSKIRKWRKSALPSPSATMLYLFSGPDYVYANAFFPDATTYILTGLEPVGTLPEPDKLSAGARAAGLAQLRSSLQTILSISFFITKDMKKKLGAGAFKGTTPILYVFLARAGKKLIKAELVRLNTDGTVSLASAGKAKGSSPGVRIVFAGKDGKQRTLYYFRTDLSDAGMAKSGFARFVAKLAPVDSLLKSTSYLVHYDSFSRARDLVLKHSATIVQTDSGVPLRFFKRKQWTLQPYGRYVGPIKLFANRYQRDLSRLYKKVGAKPMGFGVGYHHRVSQSNLLVATRKAATGTTQ